MARPIKAGLDYFPFDVDFFQDIRIRKLIKAQSGAAVTVYALLLCSIYKEGYYMRWDTELPFVISEQSGFDEAYISEVIKSCVRVGLFDKGLFDTHGVFTSKGIQERYMKICQLSRRACGISDFSLVSSEFTHVSSEETKVFSEETPVSSAKSTQSKVKKRKLKKEESKKKIGDAPDFRSLSVEEVGIFLEGEGLAATDPDDFLNYYNTVGWTERGAPVADWRAAARRWNARELRKTAGAVARNPKGASTASVSPATARKIDAPATGSTTAQPPNGVGSWEAYCRSAGIDPSTSAADLSARLSSPDLPNVKHNHHE